MIRCGVHPDEFAVSAPPPHLAPPGVASKPCHLVSSVDQPALATLACSAIPRIPLILRRSFPGNSGLGTNDSASVGVGSSATIPGHSPPKPRFGDNWRQVFVVLARKSATRQSGDQKQIAQNNQCLQRFRAAMRNSTSSPPRLRPPPSAPSFSRDSLHTSGRPQSSGTSTPRSAPRPTASASNRKQRPLSALTNVIFLADHSP